MYSYDCDLNQITEDVDNNLWIAGIKWPNAFAAKLDRVTGSWKRFDIMPSKNAINSFLSESENVFWIGIAHSGFFKWRADDNSVVTYLPDESDKNSIISSVFRRAIKDTRGNVWIGTEHGLSKMEIATGNFTNYTAQPNGLLVNNILNLCLDGDYIWVGTENGGLSRLDTRTDEIRTFLNDKYDPASLADNSVHALYKDRQQRIWVGTFSKGLCVYDKLKYKFSELDIPLENDVVNAIWQDSKKRIWIGTEGGVAMKHKDQVQYFRHLGKQAKFNSDPILSIFEDSRHQMWFGTWANGVSRYDEKKHVFVNYLPDDNDPKSLSNPNVFAIFEESQHHRMLFGTHGGINVFDNKGDNFFRAYTTNDFEYNNYIRTFFEDSHGTLWVGTIEELVWFDPDSGKITRFNEGLHNDSLIVSGLVSSIIEDNNGGIWVGTNKGLHLIVDKKSSRRFTTENGLPNNVINGILEDENGNLWISTNEGIVRFNPDDNSFKRYDMSDGLLSNNIKPNACFKNEEGWFFFGGTGVNVFHPDSIKDNPNIPPVYITDLKVFNRPVKIGDDTKILDRNITESREISLPHRFNFFSINYVALNFTSTNKNQYAYMLENFDKEWNYVGDQRVATFTNLDPGTYTFKVKASNNDELWNEVGTSLIIKILPAWWQTWWAKALAIFVFLGISVSYYRFRIKTIKNQNKRLEKLVDTRTKELQVSQQTIKEQNEEIKRKNEWLEDEVQKRTSALVERSHQLEQFTFIAAHNLRAPIARILGLGRLINMVNSNDIYETKEVTNKLVSATKECDQVVKDLSMVLDIQRDTTSMNSIIDVREKLAWIKEHLQKEITETKTRFEEDFTACNRINTVNKYFESILINLISNAIKYRHPERPPVIKVSTSLINDSLCLSISDNGIGMDLTETKNKLFTMYSQFHEHAKGKGMGLYLVKTQVVALGGQIEVESEVEKGTTFNIYFKRQ